MKTSTILALAFLVASSFASASKPPANLATDSVTGGEGPAVQSIGAVESAQPVDIMNWLIDENGNLKVSNQVRDRVVMLLEAPMSLPFGQEWNSEWFETRTFNLLRVYGIPPYAGCNLDWRWTPTLPPWGQRIASGNGCDPVGAFAIAGPEARLSCWGWSPERPATFEFLAVYLRAE